MSRQVRNLLRLLPCVLLAFAAGHATVFVQDLPVSILSVDVVALDRNGRMPDDLGPGDFTVTVDGSLRRVLWVRHVSRGPGAESDATIRQDARRGTATFAAEPARTVLALIDQTTLRPGAEKSAVEAVNAFVDRLGLDDRLAVIRLPLRPDALLELSTDRPAAREAVRQVASQAMRFANADVDDMFALPQNDPARAVAVDPDRTGDPERVTPPEAERQITSPDALAADPEQTRLLVSLRNLHDLLTSLRNTPGRKVVAFFSAGLHGAPQVDVRQIAAAAASARTVVYAFGLEGARDSKGQVPDTAPLAALATATGGRFVRVDRRPDRTIDDIMPELSACYVLGIDAGPPGAGVTGGRTTGVVRPIRVSVTRKTLSLRAPSWLAPTDEPEDVVPAPMPALAVPQPGPSGAAGPPASITAPSASPPPRRSPDDVAREADLRHALSRMTAYVEAYVREYAALVAEEDYHQFAGSGRARQSRRLRSDVLLVRPGDTKEWMCFRDVFEVDGKPLRDRDDRLKRLFLDPSLKAVSQLQAIKDESARYNLGPVIRNLNVPLFPLVILEPETLLRFRFKFGKKQESDGVERWRIDYEELIRPTIVTTIDDEDVPINGWFLIDPMTGAIIESRLVGDTSRGRAELVVKYRRDPDLGFWVPAEMTEYYRSAAYIPLADSRATYGNFRRFQVKTEQTITVPKQGSGDRR